MVFGPLDISDLHAQEVALAERQPFDRLLRFQVLRILVDLDVALGKTNDEGIGLVGGLGVDPLASQDLSLGDNFFFVEAYLLIHLVQVQAVNLDVRFLMSY